MSDKQTGSFGQEPYQTQKAGTMSEVTELTDEQWALAQDITKYFANCYGELGVVYNRPDVEAVAELLRRLSTQGAGPRPTEEFLTFFAHWWADMDLAKLRESMNDPIWAGGKHNGDCTRQAMTCNRCVLEDIEKQAAAFVPFFRAPSDPPRPEIQQAKNELLERFAAVFERNAGNGGCDKSGNC